MTPRLVTCFLNTAGGIPFLLLTPAVIIMLITIRMSMEQGRWLKWTGLGPQEQVGLDHVMAPSEWDKPIAIFIKAL